VSSVQTDLDHWHLAELTSSSQNQASIVLGFNATGGTGSVLPSIAEPVEKALGQCTLEFPDGTIHTTLKSPHRDPTPTEDRSLWRALHSASNLVARGRLVIE
jgi:hypothetical protein